LNCISYEFEFIENFDLYQNNCNKKKAYLRGISWIAEAEQATYEVKSPFDNEVVSDRDSDQEDFRFNFKFNLKQIISFFSETM
jgi:hypothetical protein